MAIDKEKLKVAEMDDESLDQVAGGGKKQYYYHSELHMEDDYELSKQHGKLMKTPVKGYLITMEDQKTGEMSRTAWIKEDQLGTFMEQHPEADFVYGAAVISAGSQGTSNAAK